MRVTSLLLRHTDCRRVSVVLTVRNAARGRGAGAGDGEKALARVKSGTYDVVICHLEMPRVDGMSLYRALAAATPAPARRVIFATGDAAGTDAERFVEDSGCRWLARPFRLADLPRAVRDALG